MMRLIDRLFGRMRVEPPAVGQVWRSANNGEAILVHSIHVHATGTLFVDVRYELRDGSFNSMPEPYAVGLRQWRSGIRAEARFLENPEVRTESIGGYQPRPTRGDVKPPPRAL